VVALVREERKIQPRLGGRKRTSCSKDWVKEDATGRDRFFAVLRGQACCWSPNRRNILHDQFPSLSARVHQRIKGLAVSQPNEVWVGDLTYIEPGRGFVSGALDRQGLAPRVGLPLWRHPGSGQLPCGAEAALAQMPVERRPFIIPIRERSIAVMSM